MALEQVTEHDLQSGHKTLPEFLVAEGHFNLALRIQRQASTSRIWNTVTKPGAMHRNSRTYSSFDPGWAGRFLLDMKLFLP
ncbi:hypothetical protein D3C75_1083230 [compost metagenome]